MLLAKQGFSVIASETSPLARVATEQKLKEARLRAKVVSADMTSIPFPDEDFDAILSIGVMEHNIKVNIEKAISEIFRTLQPCCLVLASFLPRSRWIPKDDPELDMIEDNTLRSYGPEGTLHHMVDEAELRELFHLFIIQSIDRQIDEFEGVKGTGLFISAEKPEAS